MDRMLTLNTLGELWILLCTSWILSWTSWILLWILLDMCICGFMFGSRKKWMYLQRKEIQKVKWLKRLESWWSLSITA